MPRVIVPFDATSYGLPAEADAWKVELDDNDIAALTDKDWPDLRLIVVGERPPGAGDVPPVAGPVRRVLDEDWVPIDIVFVEASLKGRPGVLLWSWRPTEGEYLDLLHIEQMRSADIHRLLRARSVIDVARARIGRTPGFTDFKPGEFVPLLAEAVRALRKDRDRGFTQRAVANRLRTTVTTLRAHMKRDGIEWSAIKRGEWPPG